MRNRRTVAGLSPWIFVVLLTALPAGAQAPSVSKVEPPSWWPGHSINPVRAAGARHEPRRRRGRRRSAPGSTTGPVRVNAAGTYLFVDVTIDPTAAPGPRTIALADRRGHGRASRSRSSRRCRATGRFQGFSPDDAIYLLMPDRFANGDPSNDDPAASRRASSTARSAATTTAATCAA